MLISKKNMTKLINEFLKEAVIPGMSMMTNPEEDETHAAIGKVAPIPKQKGKINNSSLLKSLDKKAQGPIKDFINDPVALGYEVNVNSCYRSMGKQAELYKKYAGKREADVALPGGSPHNYGLGIDLSLFYNDKEGNRIKLGLDASNEDWLAHIDNDAISYKDYDLEWGGNFAKRDTVHFDIYPITVPEMKVRKTYGSKSMWERDSFEKKLSKKAAEKGLPLDSLYSKITGA